MKKLREIWIDYFAGIIPVQNYLTQLDGGDAGFKVVLKSQQVQVVIKFDRIFAIQMLDEGVDLNTPDGYELDASFWEQSSKHFPSTIYRIENGAFSERIRLLMGESLFAAHGFQEYRIVTLNYVIAVICQTPPEILIEHRTGDGGVSYARHKTQDRGRFSGRQRDGSAVPPWFPQSNPT